jgi:hypothetical protein
VEASNPYEGFAVSAALQVQYFGADQTGAKSEQLLHAVVAERLGFELEPFCGR